MDIGQKITLLKESMGFKNYKDFAKFVDLPSDWCLDLSKKQEITNVDISRLVKISNKFNVTIDWLLSDIDVEDEQNIQQSFPDDDVVSLLYNIQEKIINGDSSFEGNVMNKDISKLACDCMDILRKLIRQNV